MFKSRLEDNLEWLERHPEGEAALEDALVQWESVHGRLPDDYEMDLVADLVRRELDPVKIWQTRLAMTCFMAACCYWLLSLIMTVLSAGK